MWIMFDAGRREEVHGILYKGILFLFYGYVPPSLNNGKVAVIIVRFYMDNVKT